MEKSRKIEQKYRVISVTLHTDKHVVDESGKLQKEQEELKVVNGCLVVDLMTELKLARGQYKIYGINFAPEPDFTPAA